jgi:hypothetical protein
MPAAIAGVRRSQRRRPCQVCQLCQCAACDTHSLFVSPFVDPFPRQPTRPGCRVAARCYSLIYSYIHLSSMSLNKKSSSTAATLYVKLAAGCVGTPVHSRPQSHRASTQARRLPYLIGLRRSGRLRPAHIRCHPPEAGRMPAVQGSGETPRARSETCAQWRRARPLAHGATQPQPGRGQGAGPSPGGCLAPPLGLSRQAR